MTLAAANIATRDKGPAKALGGETDPGFTGGAAAGAGSGGDGGTGNGTGEGSGNASNTPEGATPSDGGTGNGTGEGSGSGGGTGNGTGEGSGNTSNTPEGATPSDSGTEETPDDDSSTDGQQSEPQISGGGNPKKTTVNGPLRLSDKKELIFEAPKITRLRLGAYTTYTGDGWERDSESRERVTGAIKTDGGNNPEPEYQVDVTTRRRFSSLATVWRPAYADADRDVFINSNRGLTVDEPFEANATYRTVTYGPPSTQQARDAKGDSYSSEIESRYMQLPSDTPNRLGRQTNKITADAETPYEAAAAIRTWLKTNKDYSLNVSHNQDNGVAEAFVFEMDAGYCQYFATAMTVMLRTQDIPARYVTGYGAGETIGENRYLLRGKNAHAWVEVYFEDVGWVTFDPTPSDGRQNANRDAQPIGNEDDQQSQSQRENQTENQSDISPLNISTDREPVPGAELTVTVTQGDSPVPDAEVFFNNDSVGFTNTSGQTTGEVPYEDDFKITARKNGETEQRRQSRARSTTEESYSFRKESDGSDPPRTTTHAGSDPEITSQRDGDTTRLQWGGDEPSVKEAYSPRKEVLTSDGQGPVTRMSLQSDDSSETVTKSFDLETNVSIAVISDTVPGTKMQLRAEIDGVPVADARVEMDNLTTRTNENGVATVPVPFHREPELAVTRGDVSGKRSLPIPYNLTLEVLDEASAGTETDLVVTVADEPVSEAIVEIGNTSVKTGSDGTATVELPFQKNAILTAKRGEFADKQEIPLNTTLEVAVAGRVAPGFKTTVTVTNNEEPVEGVAVALGGTEYATTGANGAATVRPITLGTSTTVVAERGAARGSSGPYSVWPYWLAYSAGLAVIALLFSWRAGLLGRVENTRNWAPRLQTIIQKLDQIVRRSLIKTVETAVTVVRLVRWTVATGREWIAAAARDFTGTISRSAYRMQAWATATKERVMALLSLLRTPSSWKAVLVWLAGLPKRGSRLLRYSDTEDNAQTEPIPDTGLETATVRETFEDWLDKEPTEEDIDYFERILDAWHELETTTGPRPEWTPTEVAERARRQGYPPESIEELTQVFQRVRYGNHTPTSEMATTARNAAETLPGEED